MFHGRSTSEPTYRQEKEKDASFADRLRELGTQKVRVTAIIASSIGAVYKPSLKDLQKVMKCTDRQINKTTKQMSKAVIRGSMKIRR
jgi:cyanate lyase